MARDGGHFKKTKFATIKSPDKTSETSKRRQNRGFKDLETSSRKHRRAKQRLIAACTIGGKVIKPGEKVDPPVGALAGGKLKSFTATGGGALKYH